ncbi:crystallin [Tumebacillus flagellatus]|uniref:Crystallin n=1 Tax=Tumebacillus flagellatus TaxID=1157490 RepID=A0A074LH70_9BACL|nr:crystallin [Tumebacillus flagellatus]
MHSKKDQVIGGVLGLAVADAVGVPAEFSSRERLKANPVQTMEGYGTHNQPPGTWSDDSSMTFCLLESLCKGYDLDDLADRFVRWYRDAYWTPHGVVFDIGIATSKAISKLMQGVPAVQAGGTSESDNGNGSLMRILPLAYFLESVEDEQKRLEIIHQVSAVTHGHLRSQIGCAIYVEMALQLLKGLPPHLAYVNMQENVLKYYSNGGQEVADELENYDRVLKGKIFRAPQSTIRSSGYVVHTLEAALWCFLQNLTYKGTVLDAVNLGEDTDTVAAVAGGLAGIYYGLQSIPAEWVEGLARKTDILLLCERFYNAVYQEEKK